MRIVVSCVVVCVYRWGRIARWVGARGPKGSDCMCLSRTAAEVTRLCYVCVDCACVESTETVLTTRILLYTLQPQSG